MQRGLKGLEIIGSDLKAHARLFKYIYFYAIRLSQWREEISIYLCIW